jgi:hypothetical protein
MSTCHIPHVINNTKSSKQYEFLVLTWSAKLLIDEIQQNAVGNYGSIEQEVTDSSQTMYARLRGLNH